MKTICRLFFLLLLFYNSIISFGQHTKTINPLDFGLLDAKTGIERYEVLKRCRTQHLTFRISSGPTKSIDDRF